VNNFKDGIFNMDLNIRFKEKKTNLFDDDEEEEPMLSKPSKRKQKESTRLDNNNGDDDEKQEATVETNDEPEPEVVKNKPTPPKPLDFAAELALKLKAKSNIERPVKPLIEKVDSDEEEATKPIVQPPKLPSKPTKESPKEPSKEPKEPKEEKPKIKPTAAVSLFDQDDDDDEADTFKNDLFAPAASSKPLPTIVAKPKQSATTKSKGLFDDSDSDGGGEESGNSGLFKTQTTPTVNKKTSSELASESAKKETPTAVQTKQAAKNFGKLQFSKILKFFNFSIKI
jgi:hypothetical protein